LISGLGLRLAMEVIGQLIWLGVILGLIDAAEMLAVILQQGKGAAYPRILELTVRLSGQVQIIILN